MNSKSGQSSHSRRDISFQTLDEVLSDLETVSSDDYAVIGGLTKGQIFRHLADSFRSSIDGFPSDLKPPWIARKIIGPLMKNRIIHNKMKPGFQLPKSAKNYHPDREDFPAEESLQELKSQIKRFQNEPGSAKHPFFGKLTPEEWTLLHLRHAELHLSFLVQTDQS